MIQLRARKIIAFLHFYEYIMLCALVVIDSRNIKCILYLANLSPKARIYNTLSKKHNNVGNKELIVLHCLLINFLHSVVTLAVVK